MARRRLLGVDVWARLLDPPADEREIARLYTLTTEDLALVGRRRTDATRLGYALMLLYLRHGLEAGEAPPGPLLAYVARQLGAAASAFAACAARDATRREHLAELVAAGGYTPFSRPLAHEMVGFLAASAQTIVRPGQLAGILVQELRRRRVLVWRPRARQPEGGPKGPWTTRARRGDRAMDSMTHRHWPALARRPTVGPPADHTPADPQENAP